MNKILLIIQREYLSRVKKKSFILMTLLTPILIAGFYGLIIYFSIEGASKSFDKIAVISENKSLSKQLQSDDNFSFTYLDLPIEQAKKDLSNNTFDYILHIPDFALDKPKGIELFGSKQAGLTLNSRVANRIEELIRDQKLEQSGISQEALDKLKTNVSIANKKVAETGEEANSSAGASTLIAFVAGIMMFIFIMMYGIQVMRGVIEEKTNRIIEVMISSVKPFQLMMGKIIGIALVGLTQFILWIVLTATISTVTIGIFVDKEEIQQTVAASQQQATAGLSSEQLEEVEQQSNPVADIQQSLEGLNITKIVIIFLFYFIAGYLFYSALYAAIGSAVDNETETQQFMMPVMLPLLLGYALSLSVVANDPYGDIAFWLSMIPFTSPIAMVVRLPYGVPEWQLALSMVIMVAGFISTVWLASKIYRVGILMYGKKVNFKEMIKWFRYKN